MFSKNGIIEVRISGQQQQNMGFRYIFNLYLFQQQISINKLSTNCKRLIMVPKFRNASLAISSVRRNKDIPHVTSHSPISINKKAHKKKNI